MSKYLKKFANHAAYQAYVTSQEAILPNVSYCVQQDEVHFNPNNIITYKASAKLTEVTSGNGLHVNAFNSSISTHKFNDGVGTIIFSENSRV